MNVEQLIEELQKYPLKMRVIGRGYEGGYRDLGPPKQKSICLDVYSKKSWWCGPHGDAENLSDYEDSLPRGTTEAALLID